MPHGDKNQELHSAKETEKTKLAQFKKKQFLKNHKLMFILLGNFSQKQTNPGCRVTTPRRQNCPTHLHEVRNIHH